MLVHDDNEPNPLLCQLLKCSDRKRVESPAHPQTCMTSVARSTQHFTCGVLGRPGSGHWYCDRALSDILRQAAVLASCPVKTCWKQTLRHCIRKSLEMCEQDRRMRLVKLLAIVPGHFKSILCRGQLRVYNLVLGGVFHPPCAQHIDSPQKQKYRSKSLPAAACFDALGQPQSTVQITCTALCSLRPQKQDAEFAIAKAED